MSRLLTFGRTTLELSPPSDARLETTETFRGHAAGSASNVAIAARANGASATWASKVPDSPLGRRTVREIAGHGVDIAVANGEAGRHGITFTERASAPREDRTVADREATAIESTTPGDLPRERVRDASMVYVDAATPAASNPLAETTAALLNIATEAGARTVLGLGLGTASVPPAEPPPTDLLDRSDVLIARPAAAEATLAREASRTPTELAHALAAEHDFETVVLARSDQPSVADHGTTVHEHDPIETDTVDPRGATDAFAGGFLARRLAGESIADALAAGVATGALARTVQGPAATITRTEVDRAIERAEES